MGTANVPMHAISARPWMLWLGRAISLWPAFVVISSATWKLTRNQWYVTEFARIGWSAGALDLLAFLQLGSLALYLIPRTAILGAILLTGYLGGAIASYVRIGEFYPPVVPLSTAVIAWIGIYLRDERLRALVPLRRRAQE